MLALRIVTAGVLLAGLAQAQPHEVRRGASVQLGDKIVAIPAPAGYEEASSQFKEVGERFAATEAPGAEFLLAHLPAEECQSLRNGGALVLSRYTKISVLKAIREQPFFDNDLAAAVAEFRRNSGAILDPDGPTMKAVTEKAERGLSDLESRPVDLGLNATENLGEFDVRPNVFSVVLLITYKIESGGTQSVIPVLASMTFLEVRHRLLYVAVYRRITSTAALKTELKPGMAEVKQFTTKWIDEILAANKAGD